MMKNVSLLLLRVSLGWLMVIWGADKVFNIEHSLIVANKFYFGLFTSTSIVPVLGVLQILIGLCIVVGFARKWTFPVLAVLNAGSLMAVFKSVLDPWGWFLAGTNALFYPSIIIFAASLLLIALQEEDAWVLDKQ
ncbi:DoxX family membrane protein [Vibrio sp. RC27]